MGKQIIDMIGGIVEITGNSTIDTILLCIIGVISFAVAFGLVGRIFDSIGFFIIILLISIIYILKYNFQKRKMLVIMKM